MPLSRKLVVVWVLSLCCDVLSLLQHSAKRARQQNNASCTWKPAPAIIFRLKQRFSFSKVSVFSITVKLVLV